MGQLRFSRQAENDLLKIANFTIQTWGAAQADYYLKDLETCCQELADTPGLGRSCAEIRPGLHRMERGKHVIFYRLQAPGIFISRILHQRMLPEKHFGEESEEANS